ncbi:glycosyltransferase domain-containing protein [Escherichia coli]|uniref:glycosyltransferase domain-containing protein n=1 Tax=Escherichia coli TaxID=562 RepID=UPI00090775A4|nr:glycosyltransferase domain-containing protein [Escherichia coli]
MSTKIKKNSIHKVSMRKRVVYTAIFGGYDNLIDPKEIDKSVDYICFTDDKNIKSHIWNVIYIKTDEESDKAKLNRHYKFFPHLYFSEYEESLYLDGNIEIVSERISEAFDIALNDSDISIPRHTERNCIYEEANTCLELGKGNSEKIKEQIEFYKHSDYPENNGLFENNVIFRKHNTQAIIKLMEEWHDAISIFSARDQLSLCFLMWKNSIYCKEFLWGPKKSNRFFKIRFHRAEINNPLYKKIILYILLNKNIKWYYYTMSLIINKLKRIV